VRAPSVRAVDVALARDASPHDALARIVSERATISAVEWGWDGIETYSVTRN